jgi:hypothetical protein
MTANELRIGNWVYHEPSVNETTNGEFIVSEINVFDENSINGLESSDVKPIPLTEEWLVKFGFKNRGLRTTEQRPFFLFTNNGKGFTYRDGYISFVGVTVEKPIMHVHTLQNLYFALTGEELTLKQ